MFARRSQRSTFSTRRDALVRGAYIPGASTTGPLPGTSFTNMEANVAGYISLTTANATYNGVRFWGEVRCQAPGITFTNCTFHGSSPDFTTGFCFKSYGTGYYHWVAENCLFDPYAWRTERGYPAMDTTNYLPTRGIHGGNMTLRWCEIVNCEDGVNSVQRNVAPSASGDPGSPREDGVPFTDIDRCWIHKCRYVNGPPYSDTGQSGGSPHCDAFQFNTGSHIYIRGSLLGGVRDTTGYQVWPNGYNAGDDYSNACIMLQQESSDDPELWIDDVIIEDNFMSGGSSIININYKNTNSLSGAIIRNNKLFQRHYGDGIYMVDGSLATSRSGYGLYLATGSAPSSLACTWENNTIYETGEVLPFQYG